MARRPAVAVVTLTVLLLNVWTAAEPELSLPECGRSSTCDVECENSRTFSMSCPNSFRYTLRLWYTRVPGEKPSLVVICNVPNVTKMDYQMFYSYNMTLGEVERVTFNQCPLPEASLDGFFTRLGITGVKKVTMSSSFKFNDTVPTSYLRGIDLQVLQLRDFASVLMDDDFFSDMAQLENLTITGTTELQLPERVFQHIPGLKKLGLTNNQLSSFPPGLFRGLTQLQTLSIGTNNLSHISRQHFADLSRLRFLDIYKGNIVTLPEDVFSPLERLEKLKMQYNPLISLPEGLFRNNKRLTVLYMNGPPILHRPPPRQLSVPSGLFSGLSQLRLLWMDSLNIQHLPEGILSDLTSLTNLTLNDNGLTEIASGTFSSLSQLQNLDLHGNRLSKPPADLLAGLSSLDTLYLNDNGITHIPDEMFLPTPRMERLFLYRNNLTMITDKTLIGLTSTLRELRLDSNDIQLDANNRERAFYGDFSGLQKLNLRDNNVTGIPNEISVNMLNLKQLDLRDNLLQSLALIDIINFVSNGAWVDLRHNNISYIDLRRAVSLLDGSKKPAPNVFVVSNNPLVCDCRNYELKRYVEGTGPFAQRTLRDSVFRLEGNQLDCIQPPELAGKNFQTVHTDQLVCHVTNNCDPHCNCSSQPSQSKVLVTCSGIPSVMPHLPPMSLVVALRGLRLNRLEDLKPILANKEITSLDLSHNWITNISGNISHLLPPNVRLLELDNNNISTVDQSFIDYLSSEAGNSTQVRLGNNPFICDCRLAPLFQLLQQQVSEGNLQILDATDIFCKGSEKSLVEMSIDDLCPTQTATIIAACVVATALAMLLLVGAVIYYNYGDTVKVWLYAHNLCLWLVSEEELDVDKKYDAFISYSHKDEEFVVEQLVPTLESGDPKYTLCLHFRDWLAGEWITDQIQRSVQESRRVLVVMSQNFIDSEWGRLEFLAAHRQALNDKTNRVIVIVYGELPEQSAMDPELRLYINMNTYLKWGDPMFWDRLRYALPHRGRQLKSKKAKRRRLNTDKLGLILDGQSSAGSTPSTTPTVEMPSTPNGKAIANGNGHINGGFAGDKLSTIVESRKLEQCGENVV